jgi:hypothetical protein
MLTRRRLVQLVVRLTAATAILLATPLASAGSIGGTVFEDVNYGGGAGRSRSVALAAGGSGRSGARVELFTVSGVVATYSTFTTTNGSGNYSFGTLAAGTYAVRVVGGTVSSARTGYTAANLPVMTARTEWNTEAAWLVTDHVGGHNPADFVAVSASAGAAFRTDTGMFSAGPTGNAQAFSLVTIGTTSPTGVDFGFNFSTVVNVNDTGAGSLRQFITNANALAHSTLAISGRTAATEHAIFMLSNGTTGSGGALNLTGGLRASINFFTSGVAIISPTSMLPTINSALVLDAQTQPGWTLAPIVRLNGTSAGLGVDGLTLSAGSTTVRGLMITNYSQFGVSVTAGGSNTFEGNYIGTDGAIKLANASDGINLSSTDSNTVGGTAANQRNVISGNASHGICVSGSNNNVIRGNYIGLNAAGNAAVGNGEVGIRVGGSNNTIGGTIAGQGNLIAFNDAGVTVVTGVTGNRILGNAIHSNTGLGIDLAYNGLTANDGAKTAGQPNLLMDHPVFTSATVVGTTLTVAGYVGSAANQSTFASSRVEVFKGDNDASGFGEGQVYLGFLTADANGNFSGTIDVTGKGLLAGDRLTGTATDTGNNTSEFGPQFTIAGSEVTAPGGFNAFDTATAAGSTTGVIQTKVAGSASSLALVALNTTRTGVLASFTGTVAVALLNAADNSGTLDAASGCRSSWTVIQTLSPSPAFAAGDNGRISVSFTEPEAWRDVRVRVTSSGGTPVTGCSTDNFAIRPASFVALQASDATDTTAGTTRVLDNSSTSSGVVHRSGRLFTVQARTVNAGGSVTVGYSGTPTLSIASCAQPAGCTAGTLSGSLTGADGAVAGSANYLEAGVITVNLEDASFASVDAADSTAAERTISTTSAVTFGRFVPDAYRLSWSTSPTLAAALCGAGPSSQPIMFAGQNFGFSTAPAVLATPINASGAVLANARPRYAASAASAGFAASGTSLPFTGSVSAASVAHAATSTVGFTGSSFRFERGTTPVTNFVPTLALTVTLSDTTETGTVGNSAIGHEAPLTLASVPFDGGAMRFHFGRIALRPAYGDVRQPLVVPLEVQSFNGTGWVALPDIGSCVVAAATDIAYVSPTGALSSSGSFTCATRVTGGVFTTGGRAQIVLPRPGASDVLQPAALTLRLNVGAASGLSCNGATPVAATSSGLAWLSVQDAGGSFGADPAARVTWGRRQDTYLQLRERFD